MNIAGVDSFFYGYIICINYFENGTRNNFNSRCKILCNETDKSTVSSLEDDRFRYKIGNTLVSDIAVPAFLKNSHHPPNTKCRSFRIYVIPSSILVHSCFNSHSRQIWIRSQLRLPSLRTLVLSCTIHHQVNAVVSVLV